VTIFEKQQPISVRAKKSRAPHIFDDISVTRLSLGDPWAFRPTLADGLVLSSIEVATTFDTD
jgi:hypothetical protein